MYRRKDGPRQADILLSSSEHNTFEELKQRAKVREERRLENYRKEHEDFDDR